MKFIFDANESAYLPKGLRGFGEDAHHITEFLPEGSPDREILKFVGENGYFLITRDRKIRRRPIELKALKMYGVGAFFLYGTHLDRWQRIRQVIKCWERIIEFAKKTRTPFAFTISSAGKKITQIHLD
jgi:hypothetical protein